MNRFGLTARERIMLPLDFPDLWEAIPLIDELVGQINRVKIGTELIYGHGNGANSQVRQRGYNVFIDNKTYDAPKTVGRTAAQIVRRYTPEFFNVHLQGGLEVARAANVNKGASKLLGVTVLSTETEEQCMERCGRTVGAETIRLARIGVKEGIDGIICAVPEVRLVKEVIEAAGAQDSCYIVAVGVRPEYADATGQHRIGTPTQAIEAGADFLVIGDPITREEQYRKIGQNASDAVQFIVEEISAASPRLPSEFGMTVEDVAHAGSETIPAASRWQERPISEVGMLS